MKLQTRLAPTPSGYLHLGNAWSFVLTWLAARSQGGKIHLRIDDLDAARYRDEYLEDIFETLHWLGLDWDSGPRNAVEFKAMYSQRLRLKRYHEALNGLKETGKVYACTCSREQIRRDGEAVGIAVYPGTCREKGLRLDSEGEALRFRADAMVKARDESGKVFELYPQRDMGDVVLRQKNGDPSYQLASVVDDEDAGINFVVRGMDLMPSTGSQLNLAEILGWKTFPSARFWHHALVLDNAGGKLSKSSGVRSLSARPELVERVVEGPDAPTESIRVLRGKFPDSSHVCRYFARYLGMESNGVFSVRDLLAGFWMEKVATMPLNLSDFWSGLDKGV